MIMGKASNCFPSSLRRRERKYNRKKYEKRHSCSVFVHCKKPNTHPDIQVYMKKYTSYELQKEVRI